MDQKARDFKHGLECMKKEDFSRAKRIFSQLESMGVDPHQEDYFFYLKALAHMRLEESSVAKSYFQRLLDKKPNTFLFCQASLLLGYILTSEEKYKEAELNLNALLQSNYENPQVYSILGYIYHAKKDYAQAEYYYQKSLALDPENANSNNSMGYNYLEWGPEYFNEAFPFLRKAVEIDEENAAYLDSIGWYFTLRKNLSKALYFLKKSLRIKRHRVTESHLNEANKIH